MPTLQVFPDNTVAFVDDDGNVLAEQSYDSTESLIEFVDSGGSPVSISADQVSLNSAPSADTDAARKAEIDAKADLTSETGVLVSSQVPALSITSVQTVADETERLGLDVQEGDVAIQEDNNTTYLFTGDDPSVDSNWSQVEVDVLGAIEGQQILPSDVGSTTTPVGTITVTTTQDTSGQTMLSEVVASGTVTLSSGVASVDTGVSDTDATFTLALGVDTQDAKVGGRIYLDSGTGTYQVEIVERGTSVGNPSVDYKVIRVD